MNHVETALEALTAIDEKLTKIGGESARLVAEINTLQNQVANLEIPQEVLDSIARLQTHAEAIDALVPDVSGETA